MPKIESSFLREAIMKSRKIITHLLAILLMVYGCKKEESAPIYPNTTPRVELYITPTNYVFGDTVIISGKIIENNRYVKFASVFLDDVVVYSTEADEFKFYLPTTNIGIGEHQIRLVAKDHRDNPGEDSETIKISSSNPAVETINVLKIGTNSATIIGKLISTGGNATSWGICYNRIGDPSKDENTFVASSIDSTFSIEITNLEKKVSYYAKTWISSGSEDFYGKELKFYTTDEVGIYIDQRDQKSYSWIKIGSQVWMAENLVWEGDDNNVKIINDRDQWSISRNGCSYYFGNKKEYIHYGLFYQFKAAQKACPSGWHLPSDKEWKELEQTIGGSDIAGKAIKSILGWKDERNGSNQSGFNAIPTGYRDNGGGYFWDSSLEGKYAIWWADTINDVFATQYSVQFDSDSLFKFDQMLINSGRNVRCVKDK